ncbi:membrane lipoprotein lipid attachment site-containing protein [Ruminococcus albus]|uniref:Uncharacterized protein n=1 Tax=Ruminococcus albus TaxID=1264 RepID=A0A1H7KEN4_RUMAL|nr:membrane lipoprotein lipid attachment site-containing protein [Ruminococcus albus]SEK85333.1 hypothetical protein SAMN05216469_106194 [Ruminococcus albus]
MKKAPFVAVLVLLLAGCNANSENYDSRGDNNSATVEEQMGNRENDRLYVDDTGDGDVIYVSAESDDISYRDCKTEQAQVGNEHCVLSLGISEEMLSDIRHS